MNFRRAILSVHKFEMFLACDQMKMGYFCYGLHFYLYVASLSILGGPNTHYRLSLYHHLLYLANFFAFQKVESMESIGVLMMCPMSSYLENELQKRYNLHRFWTCPEKSVFLETHRNSIRAIVGNASAGADAKLIDDLPKLEIISSFSVGLDKIDLGKCKEKGIRVTNTPEVLTEDVADLAIGLILALLRRLCECDRYVRSGKWKYGDFKLTTKVSLSLSLLFSF